MPKRATQHGVFKQILLQGFLHSKLSVLTLPDLIAALGKVNTRLDEAACVKLFADLGVHNEKLARTMFDIFDPVTCGRTQNACLKPFVLCPCTLAYRQSFVFCVPSFRQLIL